MCNECGTGWKHRGIDALEEAWGIIANASDWDEPGRKEWRTAAERFRDRTYHRALRRRSWRRWRTWGER